MPPARSGIADYSSRLLPQLAQHAAIVVFVPDPDRVAPELRAAYSIRPQAAFAPQRWQFDAALYQMGNSAHHEALYVHMRRYPGIVVLHDVVLHHFIADRTTGRGNLPAYARELSFAEGATGLRRAWASAPADVVAHPLNERIARLSLGLIVHSRYAQRRLRLHHPDRPVLHVPALVAPQSGVARRDELPWPGDSLIFASFGQATANKRLDRALAAFARVRADVPAARFLVVGEVLPEVALEEMIAERGLQDCVHVAGFVPAASAFFDWLATADVVVNLRAPTLGETSAVALQALAAGRPLIAYDHGWYAELPDDVAVKVPPLDDEALAAAMKALATNPERRRALGQRVAAYAHEAHAPALCARAYVAAVQRVLHTVYEKGRLYA
jgi:glycosyltransferase involved in cell wall biosynthesis